MSHSRALEVNGVNTIIDSANPLIYEFHGHYIYKCKGPVDHVIYFALDVNKYIFHFSFINKIDAITERDRLNKGLGVTEEGELIG